MPDASDQRPILAIDRLTGHVLAKNGSDRIFIRALDLYAAVSRPFQQRGLYKACRLVGAAAWKHHTARIDLAPSTFVTFPASDPYWNRMLLRSYDHEPELARFLRGLAEFDYGFVDCGANIGYWSVFVASEHGGGKQVLAVEASKPTFDLLVRNSASHTAKVSAIHRAILDRSGVDVVLTDAVHEARGITEESSPAPGESVRSIAIDDLLVEHGWSERHLVVKLDVEGVERQALTGMERALSRDALVIYEDHGSDTSHALTRHVLTDRKLLVHLLLDQGAVPITNVDQLNGHKRDRTKGYNLIAMQPGSQWLRAVRS